MKPRHVPLERALSKLGIASRTQARGWIKEGRVRVGARVIRDPLFPVVPESAAIQIDHQAIERAALMTIAFHKPKGVVTTRSDEKGRSTVYSCLDDIDRFLVPVGRLDFATTGLLLLTNDTRFAAWATDPLNAVPRVYVVTVRGELTDEVVQRVKDGIRDRGELLCARNVTVRKRSHKETHLIVQLDEGKNREIRRLFACVGHEVTRLKRISFGGIELGDLQVGKWRQLQVEELEKAFPGAPLRR